VLQEWGADSSLELGDVLNWAPMTGFTFHSNRQGSGARDQGSGDRNRRKEERAKSKGPRLNSLRSFSSKNLTGQAGIGITSD